VLNQDRIMPGQGFGAHSHRDMEIVTWVLEGELRHEDSLGHGSLVRPGEAQYMSAGSGVTHSEFNASKERDLELLQMWVLPAARGGAPRYAQRSYPTAARRGRLCLLASPEGSADSLVIGQDARLFAGLLDGSESVRHPLARDRAAWLHVARGQLVLQGVTLGPGDGAALVEERELALERGRDAEFVLWELAAR
jgi:redox-sensitive bicupin YhaK (pirin superfamily)